jgi:hypothetical protein
MCTVSWLQTTEKYELFCNRDERLTRKAALPLQIHQSHGLKFLAPLDGEAGGAWVAVNECGIALCLLNRYGVAAPRAGNDFISRGLLVTELMNATSQQQLASKILCLSLIHWLPFTLVALERGKSASIHQWDGQRLSHDTISDPVYSMFSSSFDQAGVERVRRKRFADLRNHQDSVTSEALTAFHRNHFASPDAYSPCMHRADAQTVSFSHLRVNNHDAEFTWLPHAPCEGNAGRRRQKLLLL